MVGRGRCPICGSSVDAIYDEEGLLRYFCQHCSLMLKRKTDKSDIIHGDLEVVDYVKRDDEDARVSARPSYRSIGSSPSPRSDPDKFDLPESKPSPRNEQFNWGHCNYCHAVIVLSNSKFCSNCGASLGHGLEDATPEGMKEKTKLGKNIGLMAEHGKECMVCNLELDKGDDVAWCPHCGSAAHRTHLLEWIHVKDSCPICGERLTEQDFRGS